MSRVINTVGIATPPVKPTAPTAPANTAPSNNPVNQTQASQQTTQKPVVAQPQQGGMGFDDAVDLAKKGYKFSQSGIWGGKTPLGAFNLGGAASGAVSASGGTFVTGAGLAGEAGAIHTTAGAAGKLGTAGTAGNLSSGLLSGGAALGIGFLGQKLLGGQSANGAAVGATIGSVVPGVGTVIGAALGALAGGLIHAGNETSFLGVWQGENTKINGTHRRYHFDNFKTSLGTVKLLNQKQGSKLKGEVIDYFRKADDAVASILTPDQLSAAKQRLKGDVDHTWTWYSTSGNQRQSPKDTVVGATLNRYAAVSESMDKFYGGVFKRVADDKNAMGLVSTFSQLDQDIKGGKGIFAGTNIRDGRQAIEYIAQQYGLMDKRPKGDYRNVPERPKPTPKPKGPPRIPPRVMDNHPSLHKGDWIYNRQKGDWELHDVYNYKRGALMSKGNSLQNNLTPWGKKLQAYENAKPKAEAANRQKFGKWEKQVLEAYVKNHYMNAPAGAVTGSGDLGINRTPQPAAPAPTPAPTPAPVVDTPPPGLLANANRPDWVGGVKRNAATVVDSDATKASILRNRG